MREGSDTDVAVRLVGARGAGCARGRLLWRGDRGAGFQSIRSTLPRFPLCGGLGHGRGSWDDRIIHWHRQIGRRAADLIAVWCRRRHGRDRCFVRLVGRIGCGLLARGGGPLGVGISGGLGGRTPRGPCHRRTRPGLRRRRTRTRRCRRLRTRGGRAGRTARRGRILACGRRRVRRSRRRVRRPRRRVRRPRR